MIGDRLLRYWTETGIALLPGKSEIGLADWERRNGIALPQDFASYLRTANGMPDGESDESLISFWPLEQLAAVPHEINARLGGDRAHRFFYFADFLIDSNRYAICCADHVGYTGPIAAISEGRAQVVVSASFSDFVDLYLTPYTGEMANRVLDVAWQ